MSSNSIEFVLAQLRHLYCQMVNGHVLPSQQAITRIANGILSPAIQRLEKYISDGKSSGEM